MTKKSTERSGNINKVNKQNIPELRFPEFNNEWKLVKMDEIACIKGGKRIPKGHSLINEKNNHPYITVSDMHNGTVLMDNIKYVPEEIVEQISNYVIYDEDIFISVAGTLGLVGIIPSELNGANLTENADKITDIQLNQKFLLQILNTDVLSKLIHKTKTDNAQPKLALKEIRNMIICHPSKKEQLKIADFLSMIDRKIELMEKKYQNYINLKKYFLQHLFSIGEENPKLRFPEFKDNWKTVKIGEIFDERIEKNYEDLELLSVTITKGIIKRSELEDKDNSSSNKSNYKHVKEGDLVYNSMRMWQGASGTSDYEGIVSPAYTVLIPKKDINSKFYGNYFKKLEILDRFQKYSQGLTSDTWNLKYPLISQIKVKKPSLWEQNKITELFSILNQKIELIKMEIKLNKEFKRSLLSKMFC